MAYSIENFRRRVKEIMAKKGIKFRDLAEKSGIKYGYLANLLSSQDSIKFHHIIKIAEALGVEPWELLAPEGINVQGVGNNVNIQNVQVSEGNRIESKTEGGRRWELLFKDCQAKLKAKIEEVNKLREENERLKLENAKLEGKVELLERLLEQKEKTIRVLMSKK